MWHRGDRALIVDNDTVMTRGGAQTYVRVAVLSIDLTTCRTTEVIRLSPPDAILDLDLDASRGHLLIATRSGRVLRWYEGMTAPVEMLRRESRLGDLFAW